MTDTSWIGSLDVESYVQALMKRESDAIDQGQAVKLNKLNQTQSAATAQLSIYGQLQSSFVTLQKDMQNLLNAFNPSYQVVSSNSNVVAATIDSNSTGAVPGSHSITVTALAQAESRVSAAQTSNTSTLGLTDVLTISVGSSNITVNVGPTDTLQTIANNINSLATNNLGVAASVVSTGSGGYQLIVSSTIAGTANAVNISESGPGTLGFTELTPAANAAFMFDTLSFNNQSSNNATVEGIDVSLVSLGTASVTVQSGNPVNAVVTAMQSLVTDYNSAMTFIAKSQASALVQSSDPSNPVLIAQGPDPTIASIQMQLQSAMGAFLSTGAFRSLNDIGVSRQTNVSQVTTTLADGSQGTSFPSGLLQVDATALTTALNGSGNFSAIQTMLGNSTNGIISTVSGMLNNQTQPYGSLITALDGATTQENANLVQDQNNFQDEQAYITNLKSGLLEKYGKIDLMLAQLQMSSQMLNAQLASMNNKS